jgi:hypothetical protein
MVSHKGISNTNYSGGGGTREEKGGVGAGIQKEKSVQNERREGKVCGGGGGYTTRSGRMGRKAGMKGGRKQPTNE